MKNYPLLAVATVFCTLTGLTLASPKEKPQEPIGTPHPTNAEEARHALLAQAKPLPAMSRYPEDWWANLKSGKGWSVKKIPLTEAVHRITDTLRESEKADAMVHGKLDALRGNGECSALENFGSFGGFGSTPIAYLDTKTGALLLIWIAPEG